LLAGQVDPLTTGMMLCEVICAAQALSMPELAREWTDLMEHWRGGAAFGGIHGRCRVHRAELLRITGPCDAAEAEALTACAELRPWMRREYGWPLVELGMIRLRKGDLAGAEDAFVVAERIAWSAQPGISLLRLAQGDAATAAALMADAIAHPVDIPWKERPPSGDLRAAPLLDAQSAIAAARADLQTCESAARELARISSQFPSRGLAASASLAQARAALLRDEYADARRLALEAARTWAELEAPFESALARAALPAMHSRPRAIATARGFSGMRPGAGSASTAHWATPRTFRRGWRACLPARPSPGQAPRSGVTEQCA